MVEQLTLKELRQLTPFNPAWSFSSCRAVSLADWQIPFFTFRLILTSELPKKLPKVFDVRVVIMGIPKCCIALIPATLANSPQNQISTAGL
jgi:hypothetical protein